MLIYTNKGLQNLQEDITNKTHPENISMILYTDNITITGTTLLTDLTQPVGVSPQEMIPSNWTITDATPSVSTYPQIIFGIAGEDTIYGYGLIREGILLGAENFTDGPYVLPSGGGKVIVDVTQELS